MTAGMTRYAMLLLLAAAVAPGCKRHQRQGAPAHASPADPAAAHAGGDGNGESAGAGGGGGGDDESDEPAGGRRFHDATVYVDGVPVVAFSYNEMPPGVNIFKKEWDEGELFSHFLVCDYFMKLG